MGVPMPPRRKEDLVIPSINQPGSECFIDLKPISDLIFHRIRLTDDLIPLLPISSQFEIVVIPKTPPGSPTPDLDILGKTKGLFHVERAGQKAISRNRADLRLIAITN